MPWVVSIILVLLPETQDAAARNGRWPPAGKGASTQMVPEKSAAQAQKAGSAYMGVWHRGDTVLTPTAAGRAEAARSAKEDSWHTTDFSWAVLPQLTRPLFAKNKCTFFLPATLSAKGNPNTFPPRHRRDRIFCIKKKKLTVKSQQKETTSVGCKMTKRKANECPGRGPAIAEKCNVERGMRGAFAAKHMSRAVPETECLFFSRSQLRKAVRSLQAFFQFWPRDFAKQRDYSICMKIVLEAVRKNCSNEILICQCIYSWNTACK